MESWSGYIYPQHQKKIVTPYPSLAALLILKGRKRSIELFGKEPASVILPYNKEQTNQLLQFNEDWQIAICTFTGQLLYHLPKNPVLQFLNVHPFVFPSKYSHSPVSPPATLVFTDGSSNGTAVTLIDSGPHVQETSETSAQ